MGRNSAEATKASLIRAVRALRAALDALLVGFLALFPVPADFPVRAVFPTLAAVAGLAPLAALADFPALAVFPALAGFRALAGVADAAGFFALCALEEELDGAVADSLEDCPAIGSTTISRESRPAKKRKTGCKTGIGECATLIFSL
jgi:hypothetical protein